jgi:hypothetical protein
LHGVHRTGKGIFGALQGVHKYPFDYQRNTNYFSN